MLVERGLKVMNVEVVGDAAMPMPSHRTISERPAPSPTSSPPMMRCSKSSCELFHRGESNQIRLANRAIARFETEFV